MDHIRSNNFSNSINNLYSNILRGDKMKREPIFKGFDTETLLGKALLISNEKCYRLVNSWNDIVKFLMMPKRPTIYFTWNLRFDTQAILKWLPTDKIIEIWNNQAKNVQVGKNEYVNYINNKYLKITKNQKRVKLYDLAQFYGHQHLDDVAKRYLGVNKVDNGRWIEVNNKVESGEMSYEEGLEYLKYGVSVIGHYCRVDSELTYKLGMFIKQTFNKLNIPFDNPMSQAKISENYQRLKGGYPKIFNGLEELEEVAKESYYGGIFSTLKKGYFNETLYDYDINSAYPNVMKDLPNWSNGRFIKFEGDHYRPEGSYGWYWCCYDCEWMPYVASDKYEPISEEIKEYNQTFDMVYNNRLIVYPKGLRRGWITKAEYDFLKKNGFKVKLLCGVEWVRESDKYDNPFGWVEKIYYERLKIKKENKEDIRQHCLKILINSLYGKTAQQEPRGRLTNFFYASYITGLTRLKILEVVLKHKDHIISIDTDGILTDREIKGLKISDQLGEWSYEEYDRGLIVGSGVKQLWKGETYKTKARGITDNTDWDMYSDIVKNKDKDTIPYMRYAPLQLGIAIKTHHLEDLNRFRTFIRRLKVNMDTKRCWKRLNNFGELLEGIYDSRSWSVEEIKKGCYKSINK